MLSAKDKVVSCAQKNHSSAVWHGQSVSPFWCGMPIRFANKKARMKGVLDSLATVGGGGTSYRRRMHPEPVLTPLCESGVSFTLTFLPCRHPVSMQFQVFFSGTAVRFAGEFKLRMMPRNSCMPLYKLNASRNPKLCYHYLLPRKHSQCLAVEHFPDKGMTRAAKVSQAPGLLCIHCISLQTITR